MCYCHYNVEYVPDRDRFGNKITKAIFTEHDCTKRFETSPLVPVVSPTARLNISVGTWFRLEMSFEMLQEVSNNNLNGDIVYIMYNNNV